MHSLLRPNILALAPYSTARDDCHAATPLDVYLDANESPYNNGVNRYPDPHQAALKEVLAKIKGVAASRIFVGNGSDEAIDLLFRLFCRPGKDNIVTIAPSYGMYTVCAAVNDVEVRPVLLEADTFALPAEKLLAAADEHTKLLFICSPNNPTANAFTREEIAAVARRFKGITVVDEAYVDFSPEGSMLEMLNELPRLVVLQTLSKAWGMAGLRLGLAFASEEIADFMGRVKYPYNVNGPTQQEVVRRLATEAHDAHVAEIIAERQRLAEALKHSPKIVKIYPSSANFLLVQTHPDEATALYDALIARGIIVRNRTTQPLCKDCLRITIGTREENNRVIEALRA